MRKLIPLFLLVGMLSGCATLDMDRILATLSGKQQSSATVTTAQASVEPVKEHIFPFFLNEMQRQAPIDIKIKSWLLNDREANYPVKEVFLSVATSGDDKIPMADVEKIQWNEDERFYYITAVDGSKYQVRVIRFIGCNAEYSKACASAWIGSTEIRVWGRYDDKFMRYHFDAFNELGPISKRTVAIPVQTETVTFMNEHPKVKKNAKRK